MTRLSGALGLKCKDTVTPGLWLRGVLQENVVVVAMQTSPIARMDVIRPVNASATSSPRIAIQSWPVIAKPGIFRIPAINGVLRNVRLGVPTMACVQHHHLLHQLFDQLLHQHSPAQRHTILRKKPDGSHSLLSLLTHLLSQLLDFQLNNMLFFKKHKDFLSWFMTRVLRLWSLLPEAPTQTSGRTSSLTRFLVLSLFYLRRSPRLSESQNQKCHMLTGGFSIGQNTS